MEDEEKEEEAHVLHRHLDVQLTVSILCYFLLLVCMLNTVNVTITTCH